MQGAEAGVAGLPLPGWGGRAHAHSEPSGKLGSSRGPQRPRPRPARCTWPELPPLTPPSLRTLALQQSPVTGAIVGPPHDPRGPASEFHRVRTGGSGVGDGGKGTDVQVTADTDSGSASGKTHLHAAAGRVWEHGAGAGAPGRRCGTRGPGPGTVPQPDTRQPCDLRQAPRPRMCGRGPAPPEAEGMLVAGLAPARCSEGAAPMLPPKLRSAISGTARPPHVRTPRASPRSDLVLPPLPGPQPLAPAPLMLASGRPEHVPWESEPPARPPPPGLLGGRWVAVAPSSPRAAPCPPPDLQGGPFGRAPSLTWSFHTEGRGPVRSGHPNQGR